MLMKYIMHSQNAVAYNDESKQKNIKKATSASSCSLYSHVVKILACWL